MKKFLFALCVCQALIASAQTTCCAGPGSFAALGHDRQFVAAHGEPEPFALTAPLGQTISFKTPDGREGYGYEIKAEKFTTNYIFVFHEWWGLNDYMKQEAERIFKDHEKANVIAIDLYDQKVTASRDSAAQLMQALQKERAENIIKGALSYAGEKANIATIGWCMGGGWSLQASMLAGTNARACVMYYGMPEKEQSKLANLFCPVLFIWAKKDPWINKNVVTEFQATMQRARRDLKVLSYDADHAFANPSNPKHNKALADDAYKNALKFLKKRLK